MTVETEEFDLYACVELMMDLLAERAQPKGLKIAFSINAEVPRWMRGDAGRLRQVLLNLRR
jgi:signal transduction histidine kinase